MIKVVLYARSGESLGKVTEVTIPAFMSAPDVILWGQRVFKNEGSGKDPQYVECFAYSAIDLPEIYHSEQAANNSKPAAGVQGKADEELLMGIPNNLEEAIETLKDFYGSALLQAFMDMTEEQFRASSHFGAGMFIRNSWCLWWYEGHSFEGKWPKQSPGIVKWFNDRQIVHADDMSAIIVTSTYRTIAGKPIDLEGQIAHYHEHWKQCGFSDGIPKSK